ncbi:MAG: hypothetical protein JWM51_804 [Microbacteriaceae bacterium]|nr:hypothetical protein [Microbacteriaceae bacterium]
MKKLQVTLTIAGALATVLTLSACSTNDSMSGMNHDSGSSESSSSPSFAAEHNDSDTSFASGMAMHHMQAIQMSDVLLAKYGIDERVTALAEKIKAAQTPEIDTLNGWLEAWGEPPVSMGAMESHDMGNMSGTMSEEDMNALDAATGNEANTLFLTQMIEHHKGAVEMAQEEIDSGSNPDAIAMAKKIISDQTAEITEMEEHLATL